MMKNQIKISAITAVLTCAFLYAVTTLQAKTAKPAEDEQGSAEQGSAEKTGNTAEHGAKKSEKGSSAHGASSGESGEESGSATDKQSEKKKRVVEHETEGVSSIDELSDEAEDIDTNDQTRIVYRTPESCKEFTLYLHDKALRIERKEVELKEKEKTLMAIQKQVSELQEKYALAEKNLKQITSHDPSQLKDNPELAKLIKLFESFTPEEAASRLQNLDLDMTIAILKGIKPKILSQIMTALDPQLSAALSSRMVRGF